MVGVSSHRRPGLTPDDLESLSAALAAGKRATVYLRDPMPSLGLDAGASARVVSIDGSTVMVSPKGVDDQLPFEADELQKTRAATSVSSARQRAARATPAPNPGQPPKPAQAPKPVAPKPVAQKPKAESPQAPAVRTEHSSRAEPETDTVKPRPVPPKAPRRPKTASVVSVTVASAGENTWTVSVSHGSRKGKATEVTADRVARAMRELGDETAVAAVDGVIESARAAAQERIDELTRELESARAALAHLDGDSTDD
ncbi:DUF6319 family protein [Gordonia amicalis]|uniref:DUF6319 family protein n=1 Tax=Gordonia amicalis TaxID=89053 RepID=UPI0002A639A8|nr:DUF6319 family protein [Gordonia amicalis]MDV7175728.1 DUF6319 family protein [Gordonia amicalis]NKX77564.1 hypothetical protein [Gordonia amicalis]GAC52577.1 hypothetical protein GOAMI_13_01280 [Gordonia amicalis NBRC 100051 = JCM 11271]